MDHYEEARKFIEYNDLTHVLLEIKSMENYIKGAKQKIQTACEHGLGQNILAAELIKPIASQMRGVRNKLTWYVNTATNIIWNLEKDTNTTQNNNKCIL
jgi:hypothetical protein